MFKNYFKILLRNSKKYKTYTFINISGLAIGMAVFILILLYVQHHLKYDRFHQMSDRIYRVDMESPLGGDSKSATTSMVLAPKLQDIFPEIQKITRLKDYGKVTVSYGDKKFNEDRFFLADTAIFDIFSFEFVQGNPANALIDPQSIVITESTAKKYFGDADPLGKTLLIENKDIFQVTAVIKDLPSQSHFHLDFLAPISILGEIQNPWGHWGYTYALLSEKLSLAELHEKFDKALTIDNLGWGIIGMKFRLQPITHIHLYSHKTGEIEATTDVRYLYMFGTIAFLILLIGCMNFMNMATARSAHRNKEVGIRKVFGSYRYQLMGQFLGESILTSFVSLLLALILVELLLPFFNALIQTEIHFDLLQDKHLIAGFIIIALVVGVLAGSYPGFYLSAFRPIQVFKGISGSGYGAARFRKILVVIQFIITISLIMATLIVQDQLTYIRNKKLGFQKENIVAIPIRDASLRKQYESFKNELRQIPAVINVSATNAMPYSGGLLTKVKEKRLQLKFIDEDYIPTLGLEIVNGRNFSKLIPTDSSASILNESAVQLLGWEDPIGKEFEESLKRGAKSMVIGVIKDFHNNPLHQSIEPLAFEIFPKFFDRFLVKIRMDDLPATLNSIQEKWQKFVPHRPYEFSFLDEDYDKLYRSEQQMGKIFGYFSLLAILIACQGLFGLAAFTAEQRTREIGVRKVVGASIINIVTLLSGEFIKLIFTASIIALPIAYFTMNRWLQDFAYRINIKWWIFLLAGTVGMVIALVTVSYQSIKAALANPVESLRYE